MWHLEWALERFPEGVIAALIGFWLAAFASSGAVSLFGRDGSWEVLGIIGIQSGLSAGVCSWWTSIIPEERPWYVRGLLAGIRGGLLAAVISAVLSVAFPSLYAE